MTNSDVSPSVTAADQLLRQFDCLTPRKLLAVEDKQPVRQALLVVAEQSDYQMMGICADTIEQGQTALTAYATALGYSLESDLQAIEGPVYIKFNPKSGSCYASAYEGEHRGVLVSCQSAYDSGVNAMYGHLPLDLFVESDESGDC
jgi:hypothetical protein